MDTIKSVEDFKKIIELNRDILYSSAIKADEISQEDEWMKEDEWDSIYRHEVKNDGKV